MATVDAARTAEERAIVERHFGTPPSAYELGEVEYDPTYGGTECHARTFHVCLTCGSLVPVETWGWDWRLLHAQRHERGL